MKSIRAIVCVALCVALSSCMAGITGQGTTTVGITAATGEFQVAWADIEGVERYMLHRIGPIPPDVFAGMDFGASFSEGFGEYCEALGLDCDTREVAGTTHVDEDLVGGMFYCYAVVSADEIPSYPSEIVCSIVLAVGGDPDADSDGILDTNDNCVNTANAAQTDTDGDGVGDACEDDLDGDTILDINDNCVSTPNLAQTDTDADGSGNVCDTDDDNDGVADALDNCVLVANAGQADANGDGEGDVCDVLDNGCIEGTVFEVPVANGGFENPPGVPPNDDPDVWDPGDILPTIFDQWMGDESRAVNAENGITPAEGVQMLKCIYTKAGAPDILLNACELWQLTDLAPRAALIATGQAQLTVSMQVNRVAGDAQTDTRFDIDVKTFDGLPANFPADFAANNHLERIGRTIFSDANIAEWETVQRASIIDPTTDYVMVRLIVSENVFNDGVPDQEYDGHYMDDVRLEICETLP